MRYIIGIGLAICVGIVDVFAYACCVVAGRAGEQMERCMSEMEGDHEEKHRQ